MKESLTIWLMAGSLVLNVAASRLIVKALVEKRRRGFWHGWILFSGSLSLMLLALYH